MILHLIFWLGFALLFFHLLGYPAIVWIINRLSKKSINNSGNKLESLPTVTVICAAYNEETSIESKIESFLNLDYPTEKIKMIVISDDSTDGTNSIVNKYSDKNVELVVQCPRGGKQRAHNLIEPKIDSELILSTDATTLFRKDTLLRMIEVMQSDPGIGMVSGELRKKGTGKDSGESLYWKYEFLLRSLDSDFISIICATGALYLIRRDLFCQINPDTTDDFERTLHVLASGFKAVYAPRAIAYEETTEKAIEEIGRKVRIISREWKALQKYSCLLNPFRFGRISFVLFSHKLIRWLAFVFLLMMFASSLFIRSSFYQLVFILQLIFYAIGVLELVLQSMKKHIPSTGLIAYVTAMGWSSMLAFFRFVFNMQSGIWNPVRKS
jgi:cellulose synthase/poly-beta-1,6-N-acetylglucosamine synthase-like glycosyltransferase